MFSLTLSHQAQVKEPNKKNKRLYFARQVRIKLRLKYSLCLS